jgi:sec-independent protein translocase protein TatA
MELVIVLAIALIVLGPKRLPEAGKAAGRSLREFKSAISGTTSEETADTPPSPPTAR